MTVVSHFGQYTGGQGTRSAHDAMMASVPTLTDLARRLTGAGRPDIDWLHALVSDWQLLADLSFADLVLWAPLQDRLRLGGAGADAPDDGADRRSPTTWWARSVGPGARPFLESAQRERRICREGDPEWTRGVPVRHESIPVTQRGPGHRGHRAVAPT